MAEAKGAVQILWTKIAGGTLNLNNAIVSASCWIQTKFIDLTREDLTKILQKLYFKLEGAELSDNIRVTVYYTDDLLTTPGSIGPISMSKTSSRLSIRIPASKYYSIRLDDLAIQTRWRLSQMELFGQAGGQRF